MCERQIFLLALLVSQCVGYGNELNYEVNFEDLFDYELYDRVVDPVLCSRHMELMNRLEFFDASFRIPKGILTGNLIDYGNFFQCMNIKQEVSNNVIEGKHCVLNFENEYDVINLPWLPTGYVLSDDDKQRIKDARGKREMFIDSMKSNDLAIGGRAEIDLVSTLLKSFKLAVCIPKSCSVEQALEPYFNSSLVQVNYKLDYCRLPGDKPLVGVDYFSMAFFGVLGLATILSTAYELRHLFILKEDPKKMHWLCKSCSVYGNTKVLFTFGDSKPGSLDCLDGIRAFSILWVIIGHTFLTLLMAHVVNLAEAYGYTTEFSALWIRATNISVDSFFMLSGLLLVYTNCNKTKQGQFVKKLHLYYLNRFLRLFPLFAFALILQVSVLHHVADGPDWRFEADKVQLCRKYWWAAMLYIQNFYNYPQDCLGHTWYLAVDMQMYILSPLLLFWFLGSKKAGWLAATLVLAGSLIASTTFIFLVLPGNDYYKTFYVNTLTRAPTFIIGMIVGYLLHCYRKKKANIPTWIVYILWIVSLAVFALVVYSYYGEKSQVEYNLVYAFARPSWCIALGWVVFVCVLPVGVRPINWFLSLTAWKFLSRISYAMYMLHYPMQFVTVAAHPMPQYFDVKFIFKQFMEDLGFTVLVSILATVLVDYPLSAILRQLVTLLTGGAKKPAPKPETPKVEHDVPVHTKKHDS